MDTNRKTAIIVGVLFITATATAILSLAFLGTNLEGSDYLTKVSENENQIITAVIFELILALSVIGIGFMLFPILKKYMENLALGYVGIRLVEGIFIIIASLGLLSLTTISNDYVAGATDASNYQSLGNLLLAIRDWSFVIGTLLFLGVGGIFLNYLLYLSKLVPRWLSGWGLLGAVLILISGVWSFFGLSVESNISTIIAVPIAVQEMVFSVWLIVKGFSSTAVAENAPKIGGYQKGIRT